MRKHYVLLDCPWLSYRAHHTYPGLSYKGRATHVIYGFLAQLLTLAEREYWYRFVFCWDSKMSFRKEYYPDYKANRHVNLSEEEAAQLFIAKKQMKELRCVVLPALGFENIFMQDGLEADDIIAKIARDGVQKSGEKYTIVSADADLQQAICKDACLFNPWGGKPPLTMEGFIAAHGHAPISYWIVKALAGCSTDNVPGLAGVGEVTATKYLVRTLAPGKLLSVIQNDNERTLRMNKPLVELPHGKTVSESLVDDNLSIAGVDDIVATYGLTSLRSKLHAFVHLWQQRMGKEDSHETRRRRPERGAIRTRLLSPVESVVDEGFGFTTR